MTWRSMTAVRRVAYGYLYRSIFPCLTEFSSMEIRYSEAPSDARANHLIVLPKCSFDSLNLNRLKANGIVCKQQCSVIYATPLPDFKLQLAEIIPGSAESQLSLVFCLEFIFKNKVARVWLIHQNSISKPQNRYLRKSLSWALLLWKINSTNLGFFSTHPRVTSRQLLRTYLTMTNFVVHHYIRITESFTRLSHFIEQQSLEKSVFFLSTSVFDLTHMNTFLILSIFFFSPLFLHFSFRTLILSRFGPRDFLNFYGSNWSVKFLDGIVTGKKYFHDFFFASKFP